MLLNIVGATLDVIGRTGFVASLENEANITQAMVFLRSNSPQLLSGYLFAFLNTRFAQDQIARYARPTGQYNLNLQEVGHILIPILPLAEQAKIEQMILKSSSLLEQAEDSYTQAQQLLESELGLDKLRFDKPMGYTARFRELELLQRADAEFFNPELRYFQQEIAKHNPLRPITDFVSILKFSNPPYADIGLPIITQKHLGKISPDNYGDDLVAHDSWVQANPLASIRNYDLLYYSVGAYLGKTNIWLSNDKAVHASFITMLRPFDSEESGFLHVLLNSEYGILQSKCFQSGTSQPYIYPKDIRRFLIPTVSKSVRCQIHELVIDSFNKGEESKQLLAQAKSRVEQLIEEAVQS